MPPSIPKRYTIAQFAQDIAPLLPIALPEFRSLGLMTTCAHCGKTLDGVTFVLRSRKVHCGIAEAHVLSICNACATSPDELTPNSWAHVTDTSGLILQKNEWTRFTQVLRSHAITMFLRDYDGIVLTTIDTP